MWRMLTSAMFWIALIVAAMIVFAFWPAICR
jgi:hypothetical protein